MPIVRDILLGAEKRKASLLSMCRELDLNPAELYQSDVQVPFEKAYRAWDVATAAVNDPLLGLHLGEATNPSILGLVGHLMQSCPNLEEAFRSVSEFSIVTTDMFRYIISTDGNLTTLSYQPCEPWLKVSPGTASQAVDQAMAGTLNVFRILSGRNILPVGVTLARSRSAHAAEYERVFHQAIQWKATSNSLVFNTTQLHVPVVSYDESLLGMFCELVKQRFAKMKASSSVADQVRKEIMTTFMGQLPGIESMAARLNMTVRSLQRKLEEEGQSYREICSELGKEFALSLLKNREIKVSEVAVALGYADVRAFQRAFKSWTGQTPKAYR